MKVLIVYGSKRGGTAGLAGMIGDGFHQAGWLAEVRDARSTDPIADADIVVIGGALYMNRWHRDTREFCRRHQAALRTVPVWLFSSGPLDDSARDGSTAPVAQVQAIAARLEARGHMTFGGRLEPNAKGFVARSMAKKYAGDWRSQEQVNEWVHQIIHEFVPTTIVIPEARTAPEVEAAAPAEVRIPAQRGHKQQAPVANA